MVLWSLRYCWHYCSWQHCYSDPELKSQWRWNILISLRPSWPDWGKRLAFGWNQPDCHPVIKRCVLTGRRISSFPSKPHCRCPTSHQPQPCLCVNWKETGTRSISSVTRYLFCFGLSGPEKEGLMFYMQQLKELLCGSIWPEGSLNQAFKVNPIAQSSHHHFRNRWCDNSSYF